jgi:hypothetical protein
VSVQARIFGISFVGLFLELLLIRYLAVELRFFAFFKNFVLMAAFLGLGVGLGLARRRDLTPFFVPVTGALLLIALFANQLQLNRFFLPTSSNAFLWYHPSEPWSWLNLAGFYTTSTAVVLVIVWVFVPLGQRLGRLFAELPPDVSYVWDLLGSILGVVTYTAVSFLGISPKVAVLAALTAGLALVAGRRRHLALGAVTVVVCGVAFATANRTPVPTIPDPPLGPTKTSAYTWSPYYRIHWESYPPVKTADGRTLDVGVKGYFNGFYYFDALDFRLAKEPEAALHHPGNRPSPLSLALEHYSVPYRLKPSPGDVLILGGGPGNDAAVALLNDVRHVTVVEIDPKVVEMGRDVHPMRPYRDPRVTVVIDDARAYVANTSKRYDLVSFGHLDSINLVTSFSSVRLDSYVYTAESIQKALSIVKPGGLLALSFASDKFVNDKIFKLLRVATGQEPRALSDKYLNTTTFVVAQGGRDAIDGRVWDALVASLGQPISFASVGDEVENPVPTDDWPFLFLKQKRLSPYHIVALVILLALAAALIRWAFFAGGGRTAFDWHLFWLGGGFLLVETKSITELSLLFGTTWVVNAIAIVGVLVMNVLAVFLMNWKPRIPVWALYTLLFGTIVVAFAFPMSSLLELALPARLAAVIVLLYAPLFFAGAIFIASFKKSGDPAASFGSNLLGAMVGGALEYLSVVYGYKLLWLIALLFYVLSLAARLRVRPATAPTAITAVAGRSS